MKRSRKVEPDPRIRTDFALGSDGVLYVGADEHEGPRGRARVELYALHPPEVARYGARLLLAWGLLAHVAHGTDGRVYVNPEWIGGHGERKVFRGYAATPWEAAEVAAALHRMTFNIRVELGF